MSTFVSSPSSDRFKHDTPTTQRPSQHPISNTDNTLPATTHTHEADPATSSPRPKLDTSPLTRVVRPSVPSSTSLVTSALGTTAKSTSSSPLTYTSASADAGLHATDSLTIPETTHNAVSESSKPPHDADHITNGGIAAIAIGLMVVIAGIAYAAWIIRRNKRRTQTSSPDFSSLASSYEHALPLRDLQPKAPPATPPVGLDAWLSYHGAGDPRASVWPRMQSPPPQPAVAEVQSFTRTRQRPRVCDIGGMRPTVPVVSPVSPHPGVGDEVRMRPATPGSWSGMVTPLSPAGEFAPTWPYQGQDRYQARSEWDGRW